MFNIITFYSIIICCILNLIFWLIKDLRIFKKKNKMNDIRYCATCIWSKESKCSCEDVKKLLNMKENPKIEPSFCCNQWSEGLKLFPLIKAEIKAYVKNNHRYPYYIFTFDFKSYFLIHAINDRGSMICKATDFRNILCTECESCFKSVIISLYKLTKELDYVSKTN